MDCCLPSGRQAVLASQASDRSHPPPHTPHTPHTHHARHTTPCQKTTGSALVTCSNQWTPPRPPRRPRSLRTRGAVKMGRRGAPGHNPGVRQAWWAPRHRPVCAHHDRVRIQSGSAREGRPRARVAEAVLRRAPVVGGTMESNGVGELSTVLVHDGGGPVGGAGSDARCDCGMAGGTEDCECKQGQCCSQGKEFGGVAPDAPHLVNDSWHGGRTRCAQFSSIASAC